MDADHSSSTECEQAVFHYFHTGLSKWYNLKAWVTEL